jgi:hypothetical protein
VSRGKKFLLLTTLTLVALIAVGQLNHHADPGGPAGQGNGTVLNATKAATNNPLGITKVPLSAAGMQTLASNTAHLAISINFTWLLLTASLLFMQVGLSRGSPGRKRRAMNPTSFVALITPWASVRWHRTSVPDSRSRQYGATARVLPAVREQRSWFCSWRRPVTSSSARSPSARFAGFLRRGRDGAIIYPIYGLSHFGQSLRSRSLAGRCRPCDGGRAVAGCCSDPGRKMRGRDTNIPPISLPLGLTRVYD